jgi:hypothetical protein
VKDLIDARITVDEFGLDEVVMNDVDVHIERMDDNCVWMAIYPRSQPYENRLSLFFNAGGPIRVVIAENGTGAAEEKLE